MLYRCIIRHPDGHTLYDRTHDSVESAEIAVDYYIANHPGCSAVISPIR